MIYIDYEKSCLSGAHAVKELEKNKYEIISLENDWESSYGEYYKAHYVRHEEVSTATLIVTRPLVKKYVNGRTVATNADRNIGRTAIVTERIDNLASTGSVKLDGVEYSIVRQSDILAVIE